MERIVYMGTPDFAVPALKALIASPYEVSAVVTQPDKPKGRKATLMPPPVKEAALEAGLCVLQPARAREESFLEELERLSPDLIVVAAYGQILPKRLLEIPRYGCVNLHASLLPKYRGASPIQHAILDGEKVTGVTLMQMDEGLDTGASLSQVEVPILDTDTAGTLFDKLSQAGGELLLSCLPDLFAGRLTPVPQPKESPTPYAGMLKKEMGELNFNRDAQELFCQVRAMNPWPCAFTHVGGKTLKVYEATPSQEEGQAGRVLRTDKNGILVGCATGSLLLSQVQLEGKKQMAAGDFLRGFALKAGEMLGNAKE